MAELVNLIGDGMPVFLDERTGSLGGSFYNNPGLQPYSPLPLKWAFDQLIRYPRATLIDVGASTGCFSLLSRHHPDLKVYAFEPVELTYTVLKENIYLNALQDKVQAFRMGVSDYNGTGTLHTVTADGGKGVSIVDGIAAWHKAVEDSEIRVTTLDSFCATYGIVPTMIKSDCEGLDLKVLQGASETIQKYHPYILVEYSQENADQFGITVSDMIPLLEGWGYVWTNPEGMDIWAVHKEWASIK